MAEAKIRGRKGDPKTLGGMTKQWYQDGGRERCSVGRGQSRECGFTKIIGKKKGGVGENDGQEEKDWDIFDL